MRTAEMKKMHRILALTLALALVFAAGPPRADRAQAEGEGETAVTGEEAETTESGQDGETAESEQEAAPPSISVSFDETPAAVSTVDGVSCFDSPRTALIEIRTRADVSEFNEEGVSIEVAQKDAAGNVIEDATWTLSTWTAEEYLEETPLEEVPTGEAPSEEPSSEEPPSEESPSEETPPEETSSEEIPSEEEQPAEETTEVVVLHRAKITFHGSANYILRVNYTDPAGLTAEPCESDPFAVDLDAPTGRVSIETSSWDALIEKLTFGRWKNQPFQVSVTSADATSPVASMDYYLTDRTTALTKDELDALEASEWTAYTDPVRIETDGRFAFYVRIRDAAGHLSYVSSDGVIVDTHPAEIALSVPAANAGGVYNDDVPVTVTVTDASPSSGIAKVEYQVVTDGTVTQQGVLYEADRTEKPEETAGYDQMVDTLQREFTVEAAKNNSSHIRVRVKVTDTAGNVTEQSMDLDIDITAPVVSISYDNNAPYKVAEDRGYFPADRTATITVKERTNHFDGTAAKEAIRITATDAKGQQILADETARMIGDWVTTEGETPDDALHTLTITFAQDANFQLWMGHALSETAIAEGIADRAGNESGALLTGSSIAPFAFTVDTERPTGTVTIENFGTWDALVERLTFGLFSKDTVSVIGSYDDATSTVESVSYYKTADPAALTEADLSTVTDWQPFGGLAVPADEQFTVYLRIVDSAGNTTYLSTDGMIVDDTLPAVESIAPEITIEPQQPVNGLYNTDVTVAVRVTDPTVGDTFSGLKNIRYEVLNMGSVTQQGDLYQFSLENPTRSQLLSEWAQASAIVVDSGLNNSNSVVIKVYATDNAGNENQAEARIAIDVTSPSIDVSYDNNDARNGSYFNAPRRATITVTEHNFEPSRVTVAMTASDNGVPASVPRISGWSSVGDSHTAVITFAADARYTLDIACSDKAGNAAAPFAQQQFTIDQTLPVLSISGHADESANSESGNIGFVITATDTNFGTFEPVITAVVRTANGGFETVTLDLGTASDVPGGRAYTVRNLKADGIYRITCTLVDLAGNTYSQVLFAREDGTTYIEERNGEDTPLASSVSHDESTDIEEQNAEKTLLTFSINRGGSTYELGENTADLVEKYYVQRVHNDVVLVEVNADPLLSYEVTLNGRVLEEGTDYTVSHSGGNGGWQRYEYAVRAALFEKEGEYRLVISSTDKTKNRAFSDVKDAQVSFIVDRTAPVVAATGMTSGGRYQTDRQTVILVPTDDGGALGSLQVFLVDRDGNVISTLVDLAGETLEEALQENEGRITFDLEEGLYQNVRIVCDDCADYTGEENVLYDETFTDISVAANGFLIFWANRPLRYGTMGAVAGAAALLILLLYRRRNRKTNQND